MIPGFEKIVEDRIRNAIRNGDLDNLEGAGKPIDLKVDSHIPEDLRLAYKILRNADCLPPEIELKKEIRQTEDLLASMPDTEQKYRIMKKLNFLIMKFNTIRNGSINFEVPQYYESSLVAKFGRKDDSSRVKK